MIALDLYSGVRVLVLGGGGFIGRWVAKALHQSGAEVVIAARDVRRTEAALAEHGLRCAIRAHDLSQPGEATALMRAVRPAVAFNLTGYGVDPSERDPRLADRLNHRLVTELCESVVPEAQWHGQVLVHMGSALEFGTSSGDLAQPWHCAPTTLYGQTKLSGSRSLRDVTLRRGINGVVVRLFTVYGNGEHPSRLLPSLRTAARGAGDVPLTAGKQVRDFTSVVDVAQGLLRIAALHEAVPERALNLATGVLTPVREFVETAAELLGIAAGRLRFGALPTRTEEMSHDPVSTVALERLLRWKPTTSIVDGLREMLASENRGGSA